MIDLILRTKTEKKDELDRLLVFNSITVENVLLAEYMLQ